MQVKAEFETALKELTGILAEYVSTDDGQWSVKGLVVIQQNVGSSIARNLRV